MGRFLNGLLIGVGVGMLVAPMRGQEMQRLVRERFEDLRGSLPDTEQLKQTAQQVANRASQTASTLKDATQQTATKLASTTKQVTTPLKKGEQTSSTIPDTGTVDVIMPVETVVPPYEGARDLTTDY